MKHSLTRCAALLCISFLSQTAAGSYIQIVGQALPLNQSLPNQDSYQFRSDDGALTSLEYDTGLLNGNSGSARSAASVDLEQGTLDLYTEVNNREAANANATLFDNIVFDLPDGISEVEVTLNMDLQGIFDGFFGGCGPCLSGRLGFGNALTSAPDERVVYDTRNLEVSGVPQFFSITRTVIEGAPIRVDAFMRSGSNVNLAPFGGPDPFMLADLSAVLTLDLPDGVTFISDSGSFLDAPDQPTRGVPEPAPFTLLLLGLTGLTWARRK